MADEFLKPKTRNGSSLPSPAEQGGAGSCVSWARASVIIPVFGNGRHLERCLQSLPSAAEGPLDVLLVDDGSPVPVTDYLNWPHARYERLEKNRGPSHAINRGLERTTGKWVIVLNSDVQLLPGSLSHLIRVLEQNPDYDFAVAKLLSLKDPLTVDSKGDALLIGGGGYRIGHGEIEREGDCDRPVLGAAGTASLYKRTLLEEVGGFDEDFFGYLEDLDFSLRAQLRGYRCLYVPSAVVYHEGRATFRSEGEKEIFRLITRNQVWLVLKNYPARVIFWSLPRIMAFQLLWLALTVCRGCVGAYLRGMAEALWHLPRMLRKRRGIQRSRRISAERFWELLSRSEEEVGAWQQRLNPKERSLLLRIYFGLFGSPASRAYSASAVAK